MQALEPFSLVTLLKDSFVKLSVELRKNFGKKIYPSQKCSRDKNLRLFPYTCARTHEIELFVSGLMTVRKKVRGKGPKIDAAPGVRTVGSTTPLYLDCVPVIIGASFSNRGTAVVRRFRLTAVSRTSGEKRPCASTRLCFTTANRGARIFDEVHGSKNVPSHHGRVNFQKNRILVTVRVTR